MTTLEIAIAGAGIGGLTAAALLSRQGHRVRVFDRFEAPRPVGSGLVIQPVGQAVLDAIGAGAEAMARGARIWRMHGIEADSGRTVLKVDYGAQGGARFGLAIQRPALFDAVLGAARSGGAELVAGHEVLARDERFLVFSDGTRAGPFELVIDASGTNSRLSPLVSTPLPFGAIWATVPRPAGLELPEGQLCQRYRRADRMVGVMPSGTRNGADWEATTIFWSLPARGYDSWRRAGLSAWRDEVASLWPEALPAFEEVNDPDQMTFATYTHGTLRAVASPGFAIIGDAAHRASPQLGQGANMAMLDAMALGLALERFPVEEALRHYRMARRWHVWLYQAMSRAFTPQYQSDSRVLPVLRDRALYPLSAVPPIPAILTRLVCGDLIPPMASLTGR
ncbi:FAD-dependent oxidoreductase [Silicimonas sp. MF1-12-2]|uniref:FAD-dependent oxidoreductase n=1 Tax=Silicimonas sp. MF1-12-2 TaxID=3384793 RepID=UPI0039B6540E